ncbi:MAG: hypothetical protein M3Q06_01000, partial [Bacteroidota bacterium]|nr:hypothetical protein [Bacteroidota bacterium]
MKFLKKAGSLGVLFITLFFSCKKPVETGEEVDLAAVRMHDFQLAEIAYSDITITHPVITDGVETQPGEIEVVIPKGTTQLQVTPIAANFSKSGFSISPAMEVKQNFLNRVVIYRIASARDAAKAVHYYVRVREAYDAPAGNVQVTGFRLLKAKNPDLPADVESTRILHGEGTIGKIFVFVPAGTDFSSLTPTITHNGTALFYSQDPSTSADQSTTVYPAEGKKIDFSYPKAFYVVVKKGDESRTYDVIVDVRAPVLFGQTAVTTANVKAGTNQVIDATTFVNRGNHPISISSVTHSQQVPAGLNAVRGIGYVPTFGLLPGGTGNAKASVSAQTYPPGTY